MGCKTAFKCLSKITMAVFDRVAAKQAGYSDEEINQYLSQIQASQPAAPNPTKYLATPAPAVSPTSYATPSAAPTTVTAPIAKTKAIVQSNPEQEVRKSLSQTIGDAAFNIAKQAASPVTNAIKKQNKDVITNQAKIGNTKGDIKKSLQLAAENTLDLAKNTVLSPEFVATAASLAIPFGKGANIFTKALLPGAAVGGLSSAGQGDTPSEIAGNAILGAGTGGILHGAGKAVGGLSKVGGKVEDLGTKARGGVSKIRVKPSVYGASKEETISNTLNDLGITGTAQQKYAQLEPKMSEISDKIYNELSTNPKSVPIDTVRNDFLANLQDQLRSKSIDSKTAQTEIDGYVRDLYNFGIKEGKIPENISTPDLFKLKKMVNKDYQGVAKKIDSNTPLNDREKVISVARQTLDDIISKEHPEVKRLTLQQSNLYDAAPSLERQRDAVPTLRIAGTTVPTGAIQKVQDTAGRGLQNVGKTLEAPGRLPSIPATPVGQVAARIPSYVGNQPANSQENQTNAENGNIGQDQIHTLPIIPQSADTQAPAKTYVTGYSPETLYQAYLKAQAAGDKTNAASLRQMYTDEAAYQKANAGAKAKPLSSQQVKDVALAQTGLRNIQTIKQELNINDTTKTYDTAKAVASKIPGSPMARKLDAAAYEVVDAILRLRTGAQANPKEIQMYADQIIRPGDSYDAIAYKLQNYITYLESIAGQQSDVPDYAAPTPTDNTYAQ